MVSKFRNKYRVDSTRLRGYNYSRDGAYFITICNKNHNCLFGEIVVDIHDVETGLRPVSTRNFENTNNSTNPNNPKNPDNPNNRDNPDYPNNSDKHNNYPIKIKLSTVGKIVSDCWYDLPNHYLNIILDEFVVMPNHIHGVIIIQNNSVEKQKHGLSEFVRAFKSFASRRINEFRKTNKPDIWQPRFYDHIIHSDNELNRIRKYIVNNPMNWFNDRCNIDSNND